MLNCISINFLNDLEICVSEEKENRILSLLFHILPKQLNFFWNNFIHNIYKSVFYIH